MAILSLGTVLLFIVVLLLWVWLVSARHHPGLPPGPFRWPLLGCLPQILLHSADPLLYLRQLGQKYNGLFYINIGKYNDVFITDYHILKEALVTKAACFACRPNTKSHDVTFSHNGTKGILAENGWKWKHFRSFVMAAFRDQGVGKRTMEERIQQEADAACAEMAKHAGRPQDHSNTVTKAVANIICSIMLGDRYEYNDPDFDLLVQAINDSASSTLQFHLSSGMKLLQLWRKKTDNKHLKKYRSKDVIVGIVCKLIQEHKETYQEDNIRDLIDLAIQRQRREGALEGSGVFTDDTLCQIIFELFAAGMETTATTLVWAMLYMVKYPDIQERCQRDIHEVVGEQYPMMCHRQSLPFVEATLAEIQRVANTIPCLKYRAAYDNTLNGYRIPKGTWIFPLLYAINSDAKTFEDPLAFRPERFLDENGKFSHCGTSIPFGMGPRLCVGEPLAKVEVFLFFTTFLQRFKFSKVSPDQVIDLTPNLRVTRIPKPQQIVIHLR